MYFLDDEKQLAVLESRSSLGKRNQIAIQQSIADLPLSVRYDVARNYSTLYKLAQSQSVICIIKPYKIDGSTKEVVVKASVECGTIKVGTIGVEYFSTDNIEEFEHLCQKYDLSYIMPNEAYN